MQQKRTLEDLAIFGGNPAFSQPLLVGKPDVGDRANFLKRVNAILDSSWLTNNGPQVCRFEREIALLTGSRHSIAFSSATLALELLIAALDLKGEVIVPSFTFAATAHALARNSITPVFCDIDPSTFCIDPGAAKQLIGARTSAILGVHCWGQPCDIDGLEQLTREHHLKLLFDAAPALGCTFRGRPIGTFGSGEVFSFHATKFVHAFEGGAVTTDDGELASKLRLMRNFGLGKDDEGLLLGTNAKMTEISAAMGLTMLEAFERVSAANYANYLAYTECLTHIPGVSLLTWGAEERLNYQYVVALVDAGEAKLHRDTLQRILAAENIHTRRYFYPGCHRLEPYRTLDPTAGSRLPHTERLADEVIVFPTGTSVGRKQIEGIADVIRFVVKQARQTPESTWE